MIILPDGDPLPLAPTVNMAVPPEHTAWFIGLPVTLVFALTVSDTLMDVADPQPPVTTTL